VVDLGGLRLLEVLVAGLAVVDVVDRLGVGLLADVVRRRGRGAGLLLERGDPVAVLARLALDLRASSRWLAGSAVLVTFSNALRATSRRERGSTDPRRWLVGSANWLA
jgi:hypothetical protein